MSEDDRAILDVGQVTVVGTGLLGVSLGQGLRRAGYAGRIVGVGRRQVTLDAALAAGGMDEGVLDVAAGATGAGLVVLATPLGAFERILAELGEMDLGDATITDVGSTKQQVCAAASRLLADPGCFIGSHPMAGGEQHGPSAARADLFGEKPCIITPGENASETRLALVESLWQTLGMRTMRMSAADHDRTVAQISHLPHLAAVLLVELAARGGAMDVASTGFADTTRVASGDPGLWADIFETNRDAMVAAIDTLCDDLNGFKQLLAGKDTASLLELLERAKTARDQWMQSSRLDSETAEQ